MGERCGARVKKGNLLAVIDTPELDKQLQQARADLETAKANLALAKITANRWQGLIRTHSVSQQSTDQAVENLGAQQATVDSYAANVRRLEDLVSFEKVYAPFDGIITVRSTDAGWLIDAVGGANLFRQDRQYASFRWPLRKMHYPDAPSKVPAANRAGRQVHVVVS